MAAKLQLVPVRVPVAEMEPGALADHFGELDRQVSIQQPLLDAHRDAKARLGAIPERTLKLNGFLIQGKHYSVYFGAARNERTITDQRKAFAACEKALGKAGAIGAVTIPMGLVDRVATAEQQKLFVVETQTGARRLDVVALSPIAA